MSLAGFRQLVAVNNPALTRSQPVAKAPRGDGSTLGRHTKKNVSQVWAGIVGTTSVKILVALVCGIGEITDRERICSEVLAPERKDLAQLLKLRVILPRLFHRVAGIGAPQPDQRASHRVGPVLKGRQRRRCRRTRDAERTNDSDRSGDVAPSIGENLLDRVEVERAQLRPLKAGVECAEESAPEPCRPERGARSPSPGWSAVPQSR